MDNFVLTSDTCGNIMAGGYIINSRLLVPSMSGGKKSEEDDENEELITTQFAIPAGLYYTEIPHQESSVEILYRNYDVLSDDIYDNLYNNATYAKSIHEEPNDNKSNRKHNTTRRKNNIKSTINTKPSNTKPSNQKSNNKKTRKHK